MVVVKNRLNREIVIKELNRVLPISNNTYVIPDSIYEKYKYQLSLVSVTLSDTEIKKVFKANTNIIKESDVSSRPKTTNNNYIYDIVIVDGVEYSIAPTA